MTMAKKRLEIAKEMTEAIRQNIYWMVKTHLATPEQLMMKIYLQRIRSLKIKQASTINQLKGYEANIWRNFYAALTDRVQFFDFTRREYNPPTTPINAMLSYGNSLVYNKVQEKLLAACLYPGIGFIHETRKGKPSLALDIADIFKPLLVHRTIIQIITYELFTEEWFNIGKRNCYYLETA